MRVAIDGRFIQDHFPGIGRYTYNLVDRLARLREDDFVVLYNPYLPNTRYDLEPLGRLAHLSLRPTAVRPFSWREQYSVRSLLKETRVAVYHSPYYVMPYFFLPCPAVVTVHDVFPARYSQYLPSRQAWVAYHIAMRLAVRGAKRILAVSQCSKSDLIDFFGVRPEKVTVTYNGVDPAFQPREVQQVEKVREKYGLPKRFILYVGMNKPHKNLPALVRAYAGIRIQAGCPLVLAGREDPRWPQTRQAVAELGLWESVIVPGDIPEADLPALYNLAAVFVMPSLYEGFGLPLLEAMASGVPCASSSAGALPEVAGDAALLFDPRDTDAMGQAILRLLDDDRLAEELRQKGLAQAARFSYEDTAKRTLEVYHQCVEH